MRGKRVSSGRIAVLSALILALTVAGIAYAMPGTIDSFDNGTENLLVSSSTTSASTTYDGSGILGGERDSELNHSSGTTGNITLRVDNNDSNIFDYSSDPQMAGTARLTWDGNDGSATALDPIGLRTNGTGVDLTGSGSDDQFFVRVDFDDLKTNLTFKVYTDASNWSQKTVNLPGALDGTPARMDIAVPFSSFSTGGGSGATFNNVGAVILEVDGTVVAGVDLQIDFIETNNWREYGDLPSSYGVISAYHIPQGLRLGNNLDAEETYNQSVDAMGDDDHQYAPDDEDGVALYGLPWAAGGSGQVVITVNGCLIGFPGCYVNGWIDWNRNGDFEDPGEKIVSNYRSTGGNGLSSFFSIPSDFSNNYYYARFRICDTSTACDEPGESPVTNGEVEDYRWWLGPTGVDLAFFMATGSNGAVSLDWETTNENDLVGFNLWRGDDAGDADLKLNDTLIEAKNAGTPFGSSYTYSDEGLVNGTTYYYWLEAVESGGGPSSWHGPVDGTPAFRFYLPLVRRG